MAYPDEPGDLIVSLQDRSVSSRATEGHLAFGVLHGSDLAVFILPEDTRWDDPVELEVLVSPTAPESDALVERIRPSHIEVASLDSAPERRVASIRLALGSRYATEGPDFPPIDRFRRELGDRGDVISGLLSLGLLPQHLVGLGADGMRAIEVVETAQRRGLQVGRIGKTAGQIADCVFSPNCVIHPPPWRR
jgi:hypothetical protein